MTDADLGRLDGLTGFAARTLDLLGEVGVGLLILLETVFPPIPSEVILPLAGFLSTAGSMHLALVVLAATAGSLAGALALYALGAVLGHERSIRLLARIPLLDREDLEGASRWFARHGGRAVLIGRLVPGVRSLISLPAGAERMPLPRFVLFTAIGSALWNGALILAGAALGRRFDLVDRYSGWLDAAMIVAVVVAVGLLVVRRVRRARGRAEAERAD